MHNDWAIEGSGYTLVAATGTMAASLGANSVVFAMQAIADAAGANANLQRGPLFVDAIRMTYTCLVASATPTIAGRALQILKGTVAMPTGGANATPRARWSRDAGADNGLTGGVAVIATTGALTAGAFVADPTPGAWGRFDLDAADTLATRLTYDRNFALSGGPLALEPGELLYLANPAAFDATATWQLTVEIDYHRRDAR
jgi:hypothetical protein